jgi:hypothetical protein
MQMSEPESRTRYRLKPCVLRPASENPAGADAIFFFADGTIITENGEMELWLRMWPKDKPQPELLGWIPVSELKLETVEVPF